MNLIDITRPEEIVATCPECGMERRLPLNWQEIMRAAMPKLDAQNWDGKLRCLNGHAPAEMVTEHVVNS